jgi:hypothetical protein
MSSRNLFTGHFFMVVGLLGGNAMMAFFKDGIFMRQGQISPG